jgi:23S rRNA (cytosine1962-C5)-methyltransferase
VNSSLYRDDALLGPELVASVVAAYERRSEFHGRDDQTAYRLFHGYTEGCPGLTIDRLGEAALITHKVDVGEHLGAIAKALREQHGFTSVVAKANRNVNFDASALCVRPLHGELPSDCLEVVDQGLHFRVSLHTRKHCGLFLDARPARGWLRENSLDRRILNLFAFTGSLGVAALAGGARSVVHVDNKANALAIARENHLLNNLPADPRDFLLGNVYQHLPHAQRAQLSFDGIVLDPPPQVPRRMARRRPQGQDFGQFVKLVAPLMAPAGWLLCFFHRFDRSREAYEREVLDNAGISLEPIWRGTSGEDFPEHDPERKLRLTAFVRR